MWDSRASLCLDALDSFWATFCVSLDPEMLVVLLFTSQFDGRTPICMHSGYSTKAESRIYRTKSVQTQRHVSAAMAEQAACLRSPLAALLLRLCVVGLLAAAPALTSGATVGSRQAVDRPIHGPGHHLGMRSLLQVQRSSCS